MRNLRPNTINSKQIPKELKKWLYASGSLTQQLTDLARGDFMLSGLRALSTFNIC
jgi:chorismate--pyruvate lyase